MRLTSRCGRAAAAQCSVLAFGQNGNYLFELAAQPGGPVGRPLTTAGSKPIPIPGRPQGVRPCSPGLVAVHSHLVPSPVALSRSQLLPLVQFRENQTRAETPRSLFNHARYDAQGQLVAEYGTTAQAPCTTCYLSWDQIGSTRLVTDQNGQVVARHDYLPFGEELGTVAGRGSDGSNPNDSIRQKFTGKERDQESGLDYFGARYYGGAMGRFTGADEPLVDQDQGDPQSWNLYSYGRNNPLRYTDQDGRACTYNSETNNFTGDCSSPGDEKVTQAGIPQQITVGVGQDEANLIMLAGVGETLTDPQAVAQFVSDAGRSAASVIAPGPSAVAECITPGGNCNKTNLAMAMLPHIPGLGNVGEFITGQVIKRIIQTPEGPLVFSATVEVVGDTVKLKAASLVHADGAQVVTNPGPGTIKAAFDSLKGELRQAGFSTAQVTALRISGANSPRLINKTFDLR